MSLAYGIHWFRRDLRIQGNPALAWNCKRHNGRIVGVFFFDPVFLARPDFSHSRFAFFIETLSALRQELRKHGGDLLVLDARPQRGFADLFRRLEATKAGKPGCVSFNRDYEPFARERDVTVAEILAQNGVGVHSERDHLLIEPDEIAKDSGGFYQIYTPFARKWFELLNREAIAQRIEDSLQKVNRFNLSWANLLGEDCLGLDRLEQFRSENAKHVTIPIPNAGSRAAQKHLDGFLPKLSAYTNQRDIPSLPGTSQLSIFLKNGSLSIAQIIARLKLRGRSFASETGESRFLKELVWREFYYHVLWHCPRIEHEAFHKKYNAIQWENRDDYFAAWKEGKTGYPIVDAGMRQLKATGWMHNRVRMIAASFLTKDLHIDWRWGERYFMEKLLDGDLAPNNGGWQWAASTGCDPQPYFRIFNPTLQSQKFDPDGAYIKKWVPELSRKSGKALHEPYSPIVDHAVRKVKALKMYKACDERSSKGLND